MWIINILSTENRRVIHKKDGACRIKSARPEPRIYGDFPGHDVNNTRYVENFQNKCGKTYQHLLTLQNCILRSLADSDAFQSGRCAAHNGRPETLAIIN